LLNPNFQGGGNARFDPPGDAHGGGRAALIDSPRGGTSPCRGLAGNTVQQHPFGKQSIAGRQTVSRELYGKHAVSNP